VVTKVSHYVSASSQAAAQHLMRFGECGSI
jgi:hypothetical protein